MKRLSIFVALALSACPAPPPEPEPAPTPEPTPEPAPDPGSDDAPTSQPAIGEVVEVVPAENPLRVGMVDPATLSAKWIIILDSESNEPKRVHRLKQLAALPEIESKPATINSTEFKGLMPCYDVLIANHFNTRKEALAYSRKLTKRGVGNYPKNAGKYVGKQPGVEAYCAAGKKAVACGEGLHVAVTHRKRTFVYLGIDGEVKARALGKAPTLRSIEQGIWLAPLQAIKLGEISLKDPLVVVDGAGKSKTCKIARFVTLVRGTAHFSMQEAPQPVCGDPELFAEMDCQVDDPRFAYASAAGVTLGRLGKKTGSVDEVFKKDDYDEVKKRAAGHAKEQGAEVKESGASVGYRVGGTTYVRGEMHVYTGEGDDECGGPDFDATVVGWGKKAGAKIEPIGKSVDAYERSTTLVFSKKGAPYEVFSELFGDVGISKLGGDEVCRLRKPFCDCGC